MNSSTGASRARRPSSDEQWDCVPKLEQTSANGVPQSASQGVGYSAPHLRSFYTNPGSMRSKWNEVETLIQSYTYDIIGIGETWWDESYEWGTMGDTYRLFGKARQGTGGGVTLFVMEGLECMELTVGSGTVESL